MRPAVVIADSFGRAWRLGQTDVAIGAAGLVPLDQWIGRPDAFGRDLRVTSIAVADAVAAAADLARAKDSLEPVVMVRGLERYVTREDGPGAAALRRPPERGPVPLGAARRDHDPPPAHQHSKEPVSRANVPVGAARLADVLVRHVHPAVALRVQQHLLDQPAVVLLGKAALVERRAAATDLLHQVVAQLFQFAQGEQPRARAQGRRPGSMSRSLRGQAEQKRPTDSSSKRRTWSSSVRRAARSSGLVRGAAGAKR